MFQRSKPMSMKVKQKHPKLKSPKNSYNSIHCDATDDIFTCYYTIHDCSVAGTSTEKVCLSTSWHLIY